MVLEGQNFRSFDATVSHFRLGLAMYSALGARLRLLRGPQYRKKLEAHDWIVVKCLHLTTF